MYDSSAQAATVQPLQPLLPRQTGTSLMRKALEHNGEGNGSHWKVPLYREPPK